MNDDRLTRLESAKHKQCVPRSDTQLPAESAAIEELRINQVWLRRRPDRHHTVRGKHRADSCRLEQRLPSTAPSSRNICRNLAMSMTFDCIAPAGATAPCILHRAGPPGRTLGDHQVYLFTLWRKMSSSLPCPSLQMPTTHESHNWEGRR